MSLKIIEQREVLGKEFKIYGDLENPLFLAKNVAELIDYAFKDNRKTARDISKMISNVDAEEKLVGKIFLSGQNRETWFLTEEGLYEVLMQSTKPIAKSFKKEVKNILKTIRKHGMYAKDEILENPDLLIQVATKLKEERELTKRLQQKVEKDAPKVEYYEKVLDTDDCLTVTQLAKSVEMSARQLNSILENRKVQYKQSGQWHLYKKYQKNDYTRTRTVVSGGKSYVYTVWTQKGREFVVNILEGL